MNSHLPPSLAVGAALLLEVFLCYAFAMAQLWCGHGVTWVAAAAAFAVAVAVAWRASGSWRAAAVTAAITAAAIALESRLSDVTFDSLAYHIPTVHQYVVGWNPIHDCFTGTPPPPRLIYFSVIYARFTELSAAPICLLIGNIEAGKAVNLLMLTATLLITRGTIRSLWPHRLSNTQQWLLAAIVAINPVAVAQMFSYMNDAQGYNVLVILCAMALLWRANRFGRAPLAILAIATIVGVTNKYNHAGYTIIAAALLTVFLWSNGQRLKARQLAAVSAAAILSGIFFFGFAPYVTNAVAYHNPLFPMFSSDEASQIGATVITGTESWSRIHRLLYALFATSTHPSQIWFIGATTEVGAFGPLWWVLTLASIIALLANRLSAKAWLAWMLPTIFALCFRGGYWMRFTPFVWAGIGIALSLALRKARCPKLNSALLIVCACCALLTNGFITCRSFNNNLQASLWYDALAEAAAGQPVKVDINTFSAIGFQLDDRHVNYINCESAAQLTPSPGESLWMLCGQNHQADTADDAALIILNAAQTARFNPPQFCRPTRRTFPPTQN